MLCQLGSLNEKHCCTVFLVLTVLAGRQVLARAPLLSLLWRAERRASLQLLATMELDQSTVNVSTHTVFQLGSSLGQQSTVPGTAAAERLPLQ